MKLAGMGEGADLRRIGVVGRKEHDDVPGCVEQLASFAHENQIDVSFEEHLIEWAPEGAKALDLEAEPVVEILAETAGRDLLLQIRICGGNNPHIGFHDISVTYFHKFTLLNHTK